MSTLLALESARLLFRQHTVEDFDAYCAVEADPEVRRYVGGAPRTREAAQRKFQAVQLKPLTDGLGLRACLLKSTGQYAGYCGLYPNFSPGGPVPGEAALGFTFARQFWGRGLATEAGRTLAAFGFEILQLKRIVATVEVGNAASVRVLEKLGFTHFETETGPRSFDKFELLNS